MSPTDGMEEQDLPRELEGFARGPHPCFAFDHDGRLIYANDAAALYWGIADRAALRAIDWPKHVVAPALRRLFRSLASDASRLERLPLQPFGQLRPFIARVTRLTLAGGTRVLVVRGSEPMTTRRPVGRAKALGPVAGGVSADTKPPAPGAERVPATAEAGVDMAPIAADALPEPVTVCERQDVITTTAQDNSAAGLPTPDEIATVAAGEDMAEPAALIAARADTMGAPDIVAPSSLLSPRAQRIVDRHETALRFVWETDGDGVLTYVSRDFVSAVGAGAMPIDDETFAAFARRINMTGHEELAQALSRRHAWSDLHLGWPLDDGPQRLDVDLSAAPAENGGFRGFGTGRGLSEVVLDDQQTDDPPASDIVAADSTIEARDIEPAGSPGVGEAPMPDAAAGGEQAPGTQNAAIAPAREDNRPDEQLPSNVVSFPVTPTPHAPDRRLEPSESAALRTIARVLGGPIGLPRASANDLKAFLPTPPPVPTSEMEIGDVTKADDRGAEAMSTAEAPAHAPALPVAAEPPAASAREQAVDSDDTARLLREARLREAELRAILDTATDGIIILSGQGRILSLNRAAEALFGFDSADVADHPFMRLLAPASHRIASDYLDGLARNGVASVLNDGREVMGIERKGGLIPLFMTIGRVSLTGDDNKFCAVLRDITPWKTAEEGLVAARRQAEAASLQKSDFLAKISHEIRTPLNAIIGFSEVMRDERYGPIGNERYREYVSDVHAAGQHILGLVNDLLDLAKIEAGKIDLNFASVKLADVVQQAVSTMQAQANRQSVILRSALPKVPPIVADQRSLRQILFNLLSNAIKFSRAGSQVIVSIGLTDEGEVTIRVRDSGRGMSSSDIETALQPFGRITSGEGRQSEGTGLGLPLTKALAEANRASFHIDSTPGVGTMVQITFPSTRVLAE